MTEQEVQTTDMSTDTSDDRRTFIAKLSAVVIGSIAAICPFLVGIYVFFDPLRRGGAGGGFVRVATLDAVPDDGVPRPFPVIKQIESQFTNFGDQPVGRVFLRREKGEQTVKAFNATCTHAGCDVEFIRDSTPPNEPGEFLCPCHLSAFRADGARVNPKSCPAPRDLDTLKVKVDEEQGIWIDFKNFRAATHKKIEA